MKWFIGCNISNYNFRADCVGQVETNRLGCGPNRVRVRISLHVHLFSRFPQLSVQAIGRYVSLSRTSLVVRSRGWL